VRIEKGAECLNDKTVAETKFPLRPDERLACQARVLRPEGELRVFVKDFGQYSIVSESLRTETALEPFVRREGGKVVNARGEGLGPCEGKLLGLAVDVGTTTLVLEVVDLEDGSVLATAARKNPQIAYGNDVISRIGHTMTSIRGLEELQEVLVRGIDESLETLEARHGPIRKHIYDVVGVGNSTMRSIFMGQPVDSLGVIPFEPQRLDAVASKAGDIGLPVHPNSIEPKNAVAIGLLPPAAEKVVRIGNGAIAGARLMLVSQTMRRTAEELARHIEHIKPNEREPEFAYMVAEKMYF